MKIGMEDWTTESILGIETEDTHERELKKDLINLDKRQAGGQGTPLEE